MSCLSVLALLIAYSTTTDWNQRLGLNEFESKDTMKEGRPPMDGPLGVHGFDMGAWVHGFMGALDSWVHGFIGS